MRYLLGLYFNHWWLHSFPIATLVTNITGSFALGWLTNYLPRLKFLHPYALTAIGTGMIGSFTTFSTFSVETVQLITVNKWGTAILYVLLSFWGGLFFSWLGYRLGKRKDAKGKSLLIK